MTEERIRELEGVGFEWGRTSAFIWSVQYQQMCEFKAQFGHCLVPIKYSANPKLGRWVSTQRSDYRIYMEGKPSAMIEERIRELESVEFKWETNAFTWSVRFQQLRVFKEQFGHCLVPQQYTANPNLGQWVATQRSFCKLYQEDKPSPMAAVCIKALESLNYWDKRFEEFQIA